MVFFIIWGTGFKNLCWRDKLKTSNVESPPPPYQNVALKVKQFSCRDGLAASSDFLKFEISWKIWVFLITECHQTFFSNSYLSLSYQTSNIWCFFSNVLATKIFVSLSWGIKAEISQKILRLVTSYLK